VGASFTHEYRGQTVAVTVLDDGFEYGSTVCRSLTAAAKAITGTLWNGVHFFFGPNSKGAKRFRSQPSRKSLT
jgi:hypothetical protein